MPNLKKLPTYDWCTFAYFISFTQSTCRHRAEYLADPELRVIGFSHCVVNKGGHQFSDLVQITGPGFLRDEGTKKKTERDKDT